MIKLESSIEKFVNNRQIASKVYFVKIRPQQQKQKKQVKKRDSILTIYALDTL